MSASRPSPSAPAPRKKRGCLRVGCVVVLLLGAGACGFFWWQLSLPNRLALATHTRMRAGMTVREVMAAAEQYWDVTGSECTGGIESFQVFTPRRTPPGSLLIEREGRAGREEVRFATKEELLRLFDSHPELRACRRMGFTFLVTGVPPRTSFAVELDGEGRVARVTDPHTWD